MPLARPHPLRILLAFGVSALLCGSCATAKVDPKPGSLVAVVGIEDGDVVSGLLRVEADVSRVSGGVRGVTFYVDEERVETLILSPYQVTIDTTAFADGERTVRAVAAVSNTVSHEGSVTVRFDNSGPAIRLVDPSEGSSVFHDGSGVDLTFDVADPSGVVEVSIAINGVPVAVTGPPYVASFGLENLSITADQLPLNIVVSASAVDGLFQTSSRTFNLTLRSRAAWTFRAGHDLWGAPVVGPDGVVYFGSLGSIVHAVSSNGEELWRLSVPGEVATTPALSDGVLYVAAGNAVVAISTSTHAALWTQDVGNTVGTTPTIATDALYVGTYGNQLLALARSNGATLWTFPTSGGIQSSPVVNNLGLIIFGSHDRNVYAINTAGAEQWRFATADVVWSDPELTADGDVLIGSHDGYLYRLSPYGAMRWEFDARGQIWGSASEAADGTVYIGSTFRRLYALTSAGAQRWQAETLGIGASKPQVASDGTIFLAATDGTVHAFGPSGNTLWSFTTSGLVNGSAQLSKDESLLYVGSADRQLYALYTGLVGCAAPEMVGVGNAQMMRYEASRADATNAAEGTDGSTVCARPNVVPWTNLSWDEARAACRSVGLDLCPGGVWEAGCLGPGSTDYPYGSTHDGLACNGWEHPVGGCDVGLCRSLPTASNPGCVSAAGALDASGNVREWTLNDNGAGMYLVRGGGYQDKGDDLRCSNVYPATHVLPGSTRRPDVGFRCCSTNP